MSQKLLSVCVCVCLSGKALSDKDVLEAGHTFLVAEEVSSLLLVDGFGKESKIMSSTFKPTWKKVLGTFTTMADRLLCLKVKLLSRDEEKRARYQLVFGDIAGVDVRTILKESSASMAAQQPRAGQRALQPEEAYQLRQRMRVPVFAPPPSSPEYPLLSSPGSPHPGSPDYASSPEQYGGSPPSPHPGSPDYACSPEQHGSSPPPTSSDPLWSDNGSDFQDVPIRRKRSRSVSLSSTPARRHRDQ